MFYSKEWENRGQGKHLRGFRIIVRQYNSGKDANFLLEAYRDTYTQGSEVPNICRSIPGKGAAARVEAIRQAKEIAASGLYADE